MSDDFFIKLVVSALSIFVIMYFVSIILGSNVEGLENNSSTSTTSGPNTQAVNGIAGSASSYGANIKAQTIKLQDILLISKYRSEYENAIINLDDLVNHLMLQQALSVKQSNPAEGLDKLVKLSQSKAALNSVMKFIDAT
jgi:hypothetical protein